MRKKSTCDNCGNCARFARSNGVLEVSLAFAACIFAGPLSFLLHISPSLLLSLRPSRHSLTLSSRPLQRVEGLRADARCLLTLLRRFIKDCSLISQLSYHGRTTDLLTTLGTPFFIPSEYMPSSSILCFNIC